jgi:hypothetical protein
LFVLGPDAIDTGAFEREAALNGMDLKVVHQNSQEILSLYEAPMVLIRPDQIVAWRGNDASQAQAVLAHVVGQSEPIQT